MLRSCMPPRSTQRRIVRHCLFAAGLSIALTGCTEGPTVAPQPPLSQATTPQALGRTVEVEVLDRFQVSINATGAFRPGLPIVITAQARANLPTDDVQLRITAPEIELAKLSSWGVGFSYETNRAIPATRETRAGRLESGAASSATAVVTPLAPGYYRVVATVKSALPQPEAHEGHWVRNSAVAEAWLLVTESGGALTAEFAATSVPAAYRQQPGPFRRQSGTPRAPGGQREKSTYKPGSGALHDSVMAEVMIPDVIEFRAIYYNTDASAYQPLAWALYQVQGCTIPEFGFVCDPETWYDVAYGYTDASGYFYLLGCSDVDQYQSNLWTYGPGFSVPAGFTSQGGSVFQDCDASFDMVLVSNPARVFVNIRDALAGSTALFGVTRSPIVVNIASSGTSHYSSSSDDITITTADIWGPRGIFAAAHEYGHAFHQEALWGNTGLGNCPSPHHLDTNSGLLCAFSEGFADYFAAVVRPDLGSYAYRDDIEADFYYPGCAQRQSTSPYSCTGGPSYEGSVIEAAYAAFLYDLTDAAVEARDSIAAPGSYVRDLIRSCQVVYTGFAWRRANGADEIAYCTENSINPGSYFTLRGIYPTSYSESATEAGGWTTSRVHSNWTWNLYEKP